MFYNICDNIPGHRKENTDRNPWLKGEKRTNLFHIGHLLVINIVDNDFISCLVAVFLSPQASKPAGISTIKAFFKTKDFLSILDNDVNCAFFVFLSPASSKPAGFLQSKLSSSAVYYVNNLH